uniref:Junctional adhesion molecule-like n=1 Tax=Oryctolagus cuniculus TaxID=9986 RepID=G1TCT1_RABIT
MFCLVTLILNLVLLNYSWGLSDPIVSTRELTVHVGDSALMGCVFQSTEDKLVTKVDWTFSSGERAKDEYVLYYYANLSVPVGRFQNRARLAGDILRKGGSLLLQEVQEADQGTYTCEMRLEKESAVFKKAVVLHVLPEEPRELTVHVADSIVMRCVFRSTEDNLVTKVDWTFSSGERAKVEAVLRYHPKLTTPGEYSRSWGRFQNRVNLTGDISRHDGSIVLREVKASDGGSYTCSVHLGDLVFRKTVVLSVIREETLVVPATVRPELLGGNQLLILVGIVCATILLLPVLILIVKRTHGSKSSTDSAAMVKNLKNAKKAQPEVRAAAGKHVYSSIATREVTEEEDPSGKSEATYMTMHPVWPTPRSDPNSPVHKKSAGRVPGPQPAL